MYTALSSFPDLRAWLGMRLHQPQCNFTTPTYSLVASFPYLPAVQFFFYSSNQEPWIQVPRVLSLSNWKLVNFYNSYFVVMTKYMTASRLYFDQSDYSILYCLYLLFRLTLMQH